MSQNQGFTCFYKYMVGATEERNGSVELPLDFKERRFKHLLTPRIVRAIKDEEPDLMLATAENRVTLGRCDLVGPAHIIFGWDNAFERGTEIDEVAGYNFYRSAPLPNSDQT